MESSLPPQQTNQEQQASLSQRASDLRAFEERFALAIHSSNDGWWDRDLRTNTVYFSPRWKELLGYAEDELPQRFKEWTERVHPDDLPRIMTALQQQMDGHAIAYEIDHRGDIKMEPIAGYVPVGVHCAMSMAPSIASQLGTPISQNKNNLRKRKRVRHNMPRSV